MSESKFYFKILIGILIASSACCGCEAKEDMQSAPVQIETASAEGQKLEPYRVYLELSQEAGKYEPASCYLGASVIEDKTVDGNMVTFEELTGKSHQMYLKAMHMGEVYPIDFVLECYANKKIPAIVLTPKDRYSFFDLENLQLLAEEFGTFELPIFLQLYPNPLQYGVTPEEYQKQFLTVKTVIEAYAPNVAFVFSMGWQTVEQEKAYYPGEEAVDWIGINLYGRAEQKEQMLSALDSFYYSFQKEKPLMISQLGISHYSTRDHKYNTLEAGELLKELYEKILQYPRLKGVIYMDYNGSAETPKNAVRDDYTITGEKELLLAYQNSISQFKIPDKQEAKLAKNSVFIVSPFYGYSDGREVYVMKNTAQYELQLAEAKKMPRVSIDGSDYVAFSGNALWKCQVEKKEKRIFYTVQKVQ